MTNSNSESLYGVATRAARLKLDTCGDRGHDFPLEWGVFPSDNLEYCIAPCWGVKSSRDGRAGDPLEGTFVSSNDAHAAAEWFNQIALCKAAIQIHQSILSAAK